MKHNKVKDKMTNQKKTFQHIQQRNNILRYKKYLETNEEKPTNLKEKWTEHMNKKVHTKIKINLKLIKICSILLKKHKLKQHIIITEVQKLSCRQLVKDTGKTGSLTWVYISITALFSKNYQFYLCILFDLATLLLEVYPPRYIYLPMWAKMSIQGCSVQLYV